MNTCYICRRYPEDHEDMDHSFQLRPEEPAKPDLVQLRKEARETFAAMVKAHFEATNSLKTGDEKAKAKLVFADMKDAVEDLMATLEDTL